jgi:hypothetical protein
MPSPLASEIDDLLIEEKTMADDGDHYYGKANGEFVFAGRTDATETDPYADLRPEPDATLVIKPETDAEIRQRELADQPPSPPPAGQEQQLSLLDKLLDKVGTVAGTVTGAVMEVAQAILPEHDPRMGGVERSARTGEITRFVGISRAKELDGRRQRLLENESRTVLELVDPPVYTVMEAVCASRGPLNFKELALTTSEGHQRLNWMEKLAIAWGWKWAIQHIMPPPTAHPETIKGRIEVGIQAGIIQPQFVVRRWDFSGETRIIASPSLTSDELGLIFLPDRYLDDAMRELESITIRRQGKAAVPTRQPPRPGPDAEQAMLAIYGNQPKPFQGGKNE